MNRFNFMFLPPVIYLGLSSVFFGIEKLFSEQIAPTVFKFNEYDYLWVDGAMFRLTLYFGVLVKTSPPLTYRPTILRLTELLDADPNDPYFNGFQSQQQIAFIRDQARAILFRGGVSYKSQKRKIDDEK